MTAEDLRKSILQQAIQGKLVPQDPKDEPASELLSKIRAEKERFIKEKKIKRDKNETIIYRGEDNSYYEKILATGEVKCIDDEIPFEIPETWQWCRFSSLYWFITDGSHSTPKYTKTGVPFVSVKDMSSGHLCFTDTKFISEEEHRFLSKRCNPQKGDLLISKVGTTGIPLIIEEEKEFSIFVSLALIKFNHSLINSDYLICLLKSDFVQNQIKRDTRGVGNKNWVLTSIAKTLLILPPNFEQIRIVEKLKFLSSKLDKFEKIYTTFINQISSLSLELKKSILQYAIQGKLMPQLDIEGTASDLLEKIQQTKLQLVKEGKLKKKDLVSSIIFRDDDNKYYEKVGKSIADITDSIPFEIPDSWLWCRLSSVADLYTGNSINETEKKNKYTNVEGVKYIATKDVQFDHSIIYNNGIAIPKQYVSEFKIAPANSVLMCIEGGSAGRKIGILSHDVCFGNKLCCFKPYADISEYIYYYLQSPLFYSIFSSNKNGIIGGVSVNNLKQLLIPIPPLSEIKRIVNKLRKSISIIGS